MNDEETKYVTEELFDGLSKTVDNVSDQVIKISKNVNTLNTNVNAFSNTYSSKDDLDSLTEDVRDISDSIDIISTNVTHLLDSEDKLNHINTLKDVTITYLAEGDLLQYSSDGTWHNVLLKDLYNGDGDEDSTNDVKIEGSKYFLSKVKDDYADGLITFKKGLQSEKITYLKGGLETGTFVEGSILGSGAKIDENGVAEMDSLTLRSFLSVPELRFNKVDVVSGELWNAIAFGTIESVDTVNHIITLKLEDGEYSDIHLNDICRGIFHNLTDNNTLDGADECGFDRIKGFSTAYFTPVEIIDQEYGKKFVYSLKEGTTVEPCKAMKFVCYGNFKEADRRSSCYQTKSYTRYLKNVETWNITTDNITSQYGLLEGLNIPGAPNNGVLKGDGAYISNAYITGSIIQFTKELIDLLSGLDAYTVNLDRELATIIVDNNMDIISDYNQLNALTFNLQVFKGLEVLTYSEIIGKGNYYCSTSSSGLKYIFDGSKIVVTEITNVNSMYIDLSINCEGNLVAKKRIHFNYQIEGNSVWTTYNDNDAAPESPTGDGTTGGWHRNYTASAIWMSTKSSRTLEEGTWGSPNRFRGASVVGEDGEYVVFVYTNSSIQPETPTSTNLPPTDAFTTWYMSPLERPNKSIYTWMSLAIVKSDKTLTAWSTPIRITGDDGVDGTDGTDFEFIYQLNDSSTYIENNPDSVNTDDYVPTVKNGGSKNGIDWTDNPLGVTASKKYEWVCTRNKPKGSDTWSLFSTPAIWAKWGEKGMDGDKFEYIFTRTIDTVTIPDTPSTKQEDDFRPTLGNGYSSDYNWSDDPMGPTENLKAEWVSYRKKIDKTWGAYSEPSLWSSWAETGPAGGNYQYRWKISSTAPTTTPDNDNTWVSSYNDNSSLAKNTYVWLILRFKNADGTTTDWGNLIRITGQDGKDGEDGNSIEFIYFRNSGDTPSTPVQNGSTRPTGWSEHPQGVTSILTHEWVSQRILDKANQTWLAFSTPGVWSRWSERGKDGDGYEYIYRRFDAYKSSTEVAPGGAYYPDTSSSNYLLDDYIPTNYTDNPIGPNNDGSMPYEYCWTRKKKGGVWGVWSTGALWSYKPKDGVNGSAGNSISSVKEEYVLSTSNTSYPTNWSTTIPNMDATNKYLWNRETTTFTDKTTKTVAPHVIAMYSKDGQDGAAGRGIKSIVNKYLASSDSSGVTTSTSGWTDTVLTISNTKKYLWNYEIISYTDGSAATITTPAIIGTYGDKGDTGATGAKGDSIVGPVGLSILREDWTVNKQYRNDVALTAGVRLLHWVHVPNTDASIWYECLTTHMSSSTNKPGEGSSWTTYWKRADSMGPIYTPAVFANTIAAEYIDVDNLEVKKLRTETTQEAYAAGDKRSMNISDNTILLTDTDGSPSLRLDGNNVSNLSDLIGSANYNTTIPFTKINSSTLSASANNSTPIANVEPIDETILIYNSTGLSSDKIYEVQIPNIVVYPSLYTTIYDSEVGGSSQRSGYSYASCSIDIIVKDLELSKNIYLAGYGVSCTGGDEPSNSYSKIETKGVRKITVKGNFTISINYRLQCMVYLTQNSAYTQVGAALSQISIYNDTDTTLKISEISKLTRFYGNGFIIKRASDKYFNVADFGDANTPVISAKDGDYVLDMVYSYPAYLSSGTAWYRKWNSGWLECGGYYPITSDGIKTINFPISFYSTSAVGSIIISPSGTSYNTSYDHSAVYSYTASNFKYNRTNSFSIFWYACGRWK